MPGPNSSLQASRTLVLRRGTKLENMAHAWPWFHGFLRLRPPSNQVALRLPLGVEKHGVMRPKE